MRHSVSYNILQKQVIWYQPKVVCRYGAFVCRAAAGRLEALRHRLLVTETLEPLWKNTRSPQQNDRQGQRWKHRQMDGQTYGRTDGRRERQQSETTRRGKKKKPCPEKMCKITRRTFSGVKKYLPPCYRGSKNVLKVP